MIKGGRSTVDEIKARLPIEEVVGSYLKLEKSGRSLKARCPFHNEKSASFFVSPDRGGYYCFGCNAKGDIFTFVEQFEGLDFKGALKVLAEKAGVPLVYDVKADSEKDRLYAVMESATKYFEAQLRNSKEALEYLKSRGLNTETISLFRIGFAPLGWKNLFNFLRDKGWDDSILEKAGLIKLSEKSFEEVSSRRASSALVHAADSSPSPALNPKVVSGQLLRDSSNLNNYYDRFRDRIIFPICDSSGRVIAFTGRILHDDGKSAKYLNSPDTPVFDKSSVLFGLDKAKSEIRRMGYSILVEGQMDLIMSHQSGIRNVIASSGTALTDKQFNSDGITSNLGLVKRLSPNIIIAMDSDSAGRKAAMRAVASTALALGMSVKIANISGGKDPADLILQGADNWKDVLKNARHVVEFELENVMTDTADRHKIARAIKERIFPYLSLIDSEMDKAYYIKVISEKISLSEQSVWEDLRKFVKEKPQILQNSSVSAIVGTGQASGIRSRDSITGQTSAKNVSKVASEKSATKSRQTPLNRIDLAERRIFGLLFLMESENESIATEFRDKFKRISGDSYEERAKRIDPLRSDVLFEAESFYGGDKSRWKDHIEDLLMNFEEDMIGDELISTMSELRMAEKAGNSDLVAELAKKCQALSIRKAQIRGHAK